MKRIIASIAVAVLALGAGGALADTIYVSARGAKQGPFRGDIPTAKPPGQILALKFQYEALSPRDPVTGQASGKRQHKPLGFTKEWGASCPQFFQALVTNEILPEVKLDFVGVNPNGEQYLNHSIRLVNASVANIAHSTDTVAGRPGVRHLEEITLTFQQIEFHVTQGGVTVGDNWTIGATKK